MLVLGALRSFLKSFGGHLSPKIDKESKELTLGYPHEEPCVEPCPACCIALLRETPVVWLTLSLYLSMSPSPSISLSLSPSLSLSLSLSLYPSLSGGEVQGRSGVAELGGKAQGRGARAR